MGQRGDISRRSFLGAAAAVALASACGRDGSQAASTTTTRSEPLNLVLGSFQVLAGSEQRVAFGVLDGQKPVSDTAKVEIGFATVDAAAAGEFAPATRRDDGIEARPLYVAHHTFAAPGMYTATARVGRRTAEAAVQVIAPADSKVPVPGQPLPAVATPTTTDPRGVDPICTREPNCPWHEVSLDAALAESRPIALLIATPALCQSAVCGPVLDILLDVKDEFESSVRFIHAEVFADSTGKTTTAVVQALRLENEPFLFLVGPDGLVRDRFDGPYDRVEARAALAALTQ